METVSGELDLILGWKATSQEHLVFHLCSRWGSKGGGWRVAEEMALGDDRPLSV